MYKVFDYYNQFEKANITLCNPTKVELYSLNMARDVKMKLRYNALSELSFIIDQKTNDIPNPAYDYVQSKRLVHIEGFGYYIITEPSEDTSTQTPFKEVKALSLEAELINKKVSALKGTFKFYDLLQPEDTLLKKIMDLAPSWTIGTVDVALMNKYRTFDVPDSNVYNFLMTEVETSYGCIFIFDTNTRTVSATLVENATTETDIFISKQNLLESANLDEISSELVTALSVFGGGNLSIRPVNPLGGNYIYNFDYFKTTDWMSSELISALNTWEGLVDTAQVPFANQLTVLRTQNEELGILETELFELQAQYTALETEQKAKIEAGESITTINSQMAAKQVEIDNKQIEITNKETAISTTISALSAISVSLSFDNNFTPSELAELEYFIIQNSYQNKNIIVTDNMTSVELQDQAQALYDDALGVLAKSSQPRYEFKIDTVNFVFLPEFQEFTEQLELGCIAHINAKDDVIIQSVLLEVELNFNDPTDFSLIFSNRLRLDNGSFIYSDLFNKQNSSSASVNFNSLDWSNWSDENKDEVTTFINSSLDATANNIINSSNQEILINTNGLRGRKFISDGNYSPNQVWLTSSTLAFTKDNWNTANLAVGQITWNNQQYYGVVGDAIVGRILAGNQLTITNSGGNFVLDSNGATLTNATFRVQSGNTRISLNPISENFGGMLLDPGINILGNTGGTWSKKFWVDTAGNVNLTGNLELGANYIRTNGEIRLGALSISGNTSTFTGTVQADKILGAVSWTQLTDIPADKITSGTMSGNRVFGGTLGGAIGMASGLLSIYKSGFNSVIDASNSNSLQLYGSGNANIVIASTGVGINNASLYIGQSLAATQNWVNTQGFVKSGSYPTFSNVKVTGTYVASDGYTGGNGTITIREYDGSYTYIRVHDGLVTSW